MITSAKKQAQDLGKKIARQVAQEPLEILKSARGQLSGEQMKYFEQKLEQEKGNQSKQPSNQTEELKKKDAVKSSRTLQALEKEIEDIRRSKIIKELQRKIAQGEEVHLENYPELTPEERQVLNAQAEAVKKQNAESQAQSAPLVEPKSKTPRGSWLFGGKAQAEKQKTHVEKPLPPSG